MTNLVHLSALSADVVSGLVNVLSGSPWDGIIALLTGGAAAHSLAAGITYSNIPEEVLASARRWHGSIDEQYGNIDNLVTLIQSHSWGTLPSVFTQIVANRTQLATLIPKCRSTQGSAADRARRNTLLKTTVGLCLAQMKAWAYTQYYAGVMTIDDVHTLGFLLPGEASGNRSRTEATNVVAEAKVSTLSADMIRVVIDQAATDNAALVKHGWPPGVHMAVIVITAADGLTEVLRQHTTHLYNDLKMPAGSHGKQFIIKAAFLRHVDDEPRFGPQPTFSMPLTTEDLAAAIDRHHYEEYEAHIRETERHRLELEQLRTTPPAPPTHE